MSSRARGQNGVFGRPVQARLIVRLRVAIVIDAHVTDLHAIILPPSISSSADGKPGKISTASSSALPPS